MSENARDTVVVGHGSLAEAIARATDAGAPVDRAGPTAIPDGCRAVVVANDGWDTRGYPDVRGVCGDRGTPWLPVRAELGRVVIGPAELPDTSGCTDCAQLRRELARRHPRAHDTVWERHGDRLRHRPSPLLGPLAVGLVAALVADEVGRLTADRTTARTRGAMLFVDLATMRVTLHRFLPDPLCGHCGGLPPDAAASARLELRSRPKLSPRTYRSRDVMREMSTLTQTYVDAESGLIRGLYRDSGNGVVVAAAPIGLRDGDVEHGYGRTGSYRSSEVIAVLEALERYGGTRPGGKRTVVRASYREVADRAVDPRTLGVHAPDAYRLPDFRYAPFAEDRQYAWVWAHSFATAAPVLVPESYVYYRASRGDAFVYEVSNGCALGSCLEEAILYGLLEVAERDAFLMTWYATMAVPRIDLHSARNRAIPMIAATIRAETGYETMVFDTMLEHGVPCVWAMAVDATDGDNRPKAVCAAGSHLDHERATENALRELGPILAHLLRTYPAERDHARSMAVDSTVVSTMEEHSLLYGDPTVFDRLGFLTGATSARAFADLARPTGSGGDDLREDLRELVGRYLASGLDVLVVDQTTAEHRAGGFACVKVIVPGTLPMTFGHRHRRVDGLPRLYEVPHSLGYRDRKLRAEDINPHPHPFP